MQKKNSNYDYETKYSSEGYKFIAGLDEVGRGAWAGPVYTGAVILPCFIDGLRDSKMLNPKQREEFSVLIKERAVSWSVGIADLEEIIGLGIHKATFLAFRRAINELKKVDFILSDAFMIPGIDIPQCPIKKGDQISNSIAAASIIAKVERDRVMSELNNQYPEYGFEKHKGYGTPQHIDALKKHGPCEIHRTNYKPISKFFNLEK